MNLDLIGQEFPRGRAICFDLVCQFYADNFGLELPRYDGPPFVLTAQAYTELLRGASFDLVPISAHQAQPADVLLHPSPVHLAVCVGHAMYLHVPPRSTRRARLTHLNADRGLKFAVLRHKDFAAAPPIGPTEAELWGLWETNDDTAKAVVRSMDALAGMLRLF